MVIFFRCIICGLGGTTRKTDTRKCLSFFLFQWDDSLTGATAETTAGESAATTET